MNAFQEDISRNFMTISKNSIIRGHRFVNYLTKHLCHSENFSQLKSIDCKYIMHTFDGPNCVKFYASKKVCSQQKVL